MITSLEKEIKQVATAAKALLNSKLKKRTIALLIHDGFKAGRSPGLGTIQVVLEIAADLDKTALK